MNGLSRFTCLAIGSMQVDDDAGVGDESVEIVLNRDLEQQICDAIDARFLLQLVRHRS